MGLKKVFKVLRFVFLFFKRERGGNLIYICCLLLFLIKVKCNIINF